MAEINTKKSNIVPKAVRTYLESEEFSLKLSEEKYSAPFGEKEKTGNSFSTETRFDVIDGKYVRLKDELSLIKIDLKMDAAWDMNQRRRCSRSTTMAIFAAIRSPTTLKHGLLWSSLSRKGSQNLSDFPISTVVR